MNRTVRSGSSARVAASKGQTARAVDPAYEEDESRAELFLVWSNSARAAQGDAKTDGPGAQSDRRDRGLWLLCGQLLRQEGWLRLNAEVGAGWLPGESALRRGYAVAKRLLDVSVASALLVLLAPVFLLVAALIQLDSPGPAFFRQRRVGKDGVEFPMWKFRSMRVDAARYATSPTSNTDTRLTRVGRLIRRVSVDELPQLINVVRGEMSLVGPRPEMPFIVAGYTEFERGRLAVKPGITGLWQISPARAFPIHENMQYDLHYIRHQNLVLDGAILLRTAGAVIRGVGAV